MWQFIISQAVAQETAQSVGNAAQQPSPWGSLVPFLLIFIVFYFLLIRPQKRKMQEEQALLNSLGKGDEVYTKSGLIGTISGLTDKVVTLEVSEGVRIKVLRGQIGGLYQKLFEKSTPVAATTVDASAKGDAKDNKKK